MRATLQSVVLPVAAWLLSAWVPYSKAAAVSPVQKVLSMLEDMEFNGKKAMAAERVVYADYKVSVAAMVTQLEFQVTTAKSTIDELTAFIADADNTVAALSRSIAKLENDIAEKEGMKKDILAERAVQSAENNKQRVDAQESVDALEHAIQSLKSRANDVPQESLLQGIANKDPTLKNVLAGLSMLQESAVSAPAAAAYEFQSSSIIEMLEDLLVKFKDQLEEVMALETKQAHATALEVQHLTHAIESMNSELQSKIVMKGEKSADSAAANGKLASTKEDLAEAEKTLADLKAAFSVKTTTFEENQKVRKEELSAIKEASDIIGHKTVRKTYRDQIGFVQKHASFLQVSSAKSQVAKAHQNAITILKARAKALSSKNLASLVAHISASPFGKVVDMIEGLLEKLKLQATGEAEHKAWCDDQLATNEQKRSRMQTDIAQLSASIETKEMAIAQGKKDLATVLGEISKLTKDMREMTEQRQKEKAENNKAVTDAEAGEAAMKQALEILNKFYSGQAALLQNGQLQAPEMAAYKGMQDEKSGVIGMMEVILSDFSRLITDTKASEMQAVEEYKQQMADMTSMKDKKEGEVDTLTLANDRLTYQLTRDKKSLRSTQADFKNANKYYEELKSSCVEVKVSYEERVQQREAEIQALKEAYAVLEEGNVIIVTAGPPIKGDDPITWGPGNQPVKGD